MSTRMSPAVGCSTRNTGTGTQIQFGALRAEHRLLLLEAAGGAVERAGGQEHLAAAQRVHAHGGAGAAAGERELGRPGLGLDRHGRPIYPRIRDRARRG